MSDPAYQGVKPLLVPADGRRLCQIEYRRCFERLFNGSGPPIQRWHDGTFNLPDIGPEVIDDVQSFAKIVRLTFIDLRTGEAYHEQRKIEHDLRDDRIDAMRYLMEAFDTVKEPNREVVADYLRRLKYKQANG